MRFCRGSIKRIVHKLVFDNNDLHFISGSLNIKCFSENHQLETWSSGNYCGEVVETKWEIFRSLEPCFQIILCDFGPLHFDSYR